MCKRQIKQMTIASYMLGCTDTSFCPTYPYPYPISIVVHICFEKKLCILVSLPISYLILYPYPCNLGYTCIQIRSDNQTPAVTEQMSDRKRRNHKSCLSQISNVVEIKSDQIWQRWKLCPTRPHIEWVPKHFIWKMFQSEELPRSYWTVNPEHTVV